MTLSGLVSSFLLLSRSRGQVPYALLTRPPWLPWCKHHFPIDLHVLSILSAFILSQDQTLHSTISFHLVNYLFLFRCFFRLIFLPLFIHVFHCPLNHSRSWQKLFYQISPPLSTDFFHFFEIFFFLFFTTIFSTFEKLKNLL